MRPEKNVVTPVNHNDHPLFLRVRLIKCFLFFVLVIHTVTLHAQDEDQAPKRRGSRIIDDTTKQVYGPNTSKYYYEHDVFYNRNRIHPIDTFIKNWHRFNFVQRHNNLYQDLGNIGTSMRPIFYQAPEVIGVRSGFESYDVYWDAEQIRFYDTKSPYSNMNVVLGGKGRSMTRATFSRNISPRWNFGFTFRGIFIDKQIPLRRGKGDRTTRSNYYDFYTAYHSKDSIYRIFASFQRMFHRIQEYGGVRVEGADSTFQEYFDINTTKVWLSAAESNDLRMKFHFSHQYQIGKALQVYHTFDRYRHMTKFLDIYETDKDFFNNINIVDDSTKDVARYKTVRNEVGIKGNLLKLFYNGYYAIRHYSMTYRNWLQSDLKVPALGNESYLGGRMELALDSLGLVSGLAEVNQEGNYRIEGKIVSKWFQGSIKQLLYKPSFAQQAYIGGHHEWNNTFVNTQSSEIKGYVHYHSKVLNVSPGLTFTRLKNYVFFNQVNKLDTGQQVFPVQSAGNQIIFSPEFRFDVTFFKHYTISNQTIHTTLLENADKAIRVPQLFINTQVSYSNIHFNGNLDMHAGVDVHWRSAYFAPAYDPAIRQFYNQDKFQVNAFPIVDIFLNAKVKRARIFIKYNNLMQAFTTGKTGYFTTPFYPGQRNIIDFGFDWSFYD